MLFDEQITRKPNLYPWTSDIIKSFRQTQWSADKFDFQSDLHQFKTELNDQERGVVVNALSAIAQIEVEVKRFWGRLGEHFRHPSISDLGFTLAYTEVIHGEAYDKLLDVLGLQDVYKHNMKNAVILGRVKYLKKHAEKTYKDGRKQIIYSLILFSLFVENVSLFSQFYVIMWFNRFRHVLKDADQQIKYTKNEENLHALSGITLVNTARRQYPELFDDEMRARVLEEAGEALKAESAIVDWMLGDYTGESLSAAVLKEYIKDRLNQSLDAIGYGSPFAVDERLIQETQWMNEEVLANMMTDFFHQHPTEYSKDHAPFDEAALFA